MGAPTSVHVSIHSLLSGFSSIFPSLSRSTALSLVAKWRSYLAQMTFQNIKKNGLRHAMLFQNTFPVLHSATKRTLYTDPGKHFKPGYLTPSEGWGILLSMQRASCIPLATESKAQGYKPQNQVFLKLFHKVFWWLMCCIQHWSGTKYVEVMKRGDV